MDFVFVYVDLVLVAYIPLTSATSVIWRVYLSDDVGEISLSFLPCHHHQPLNTGGTTSTEVAGLSGEFVALNPTTF